MNDNAIAKLREAKLCTLFCLVPRAPVLHGTRECCMSIWLLHATPWSFSFYSLQKVSGQQILEACLKNFEWILSFALRLLFTSMLVEIQIQIQRSKKHGSLNICHYFISSFFLKRDIFSIEILFLVIVVHHICIF